MRIWGRSIPATAPLIWRRTLRGLFKVTAAGGSVTAVNDDDTGIRYSGAWQRSYNRGLGDYQDDVHFTQTNNDYFEYAFQGTGIDLVTEKDASQGNVDIYVDNVFKQTVNTASATRQTQQTVYSVSGLPNGPHTLKAVKKSGTYMLLDKLQFRVASPVAVNDTDPAVSYTGAWTLNGSRGFGDYQDDVHYTQTNNDYFQYAFNGTGIELVTEKDPAQGNVDIYVDNVFKQTVNTYNPTRLAQQTVYAIGGLPSGAHTLKAVKKSGSFMLLRPAAGQELEDPVQRHGSRHRLLRLLVAEREPGLRGLQQRRAFYPDEQRLFPIHLRRHGRGIDHGEGSRPRQRRHLPR